MTRTIPTSIQFSRADACSLVGNAECQDSNVISSTTEVFTPNLQCGKDALNLRHHISPQLLIRILTVSAHNSTTYDNGATTFPGTE